MSPRTAREVWQGELDVDAVVLPEGETGGRERLTAERLDRIATFFAAPEAVRASWGGPNDLAQLARDVGCRVKSVHLWKTHPKMIERVRELTEVAAVLAMPNILYGQIIAGSPDIVPLDGGGFRIVPGDTKAANFVATVGKFLRLGANGQTVNQWNLNAGSPDPGAMSEEEFQARLEKATKQFKAQQEAGDNGEDDD